LPEIYPTGGERLPVVTDRVRPVPVCISGAGLVVC